MRVWLLGCLFLFAGLSQAAEGTGTIHVLLKDDVARVGEAVVKGHRPVPSGHGICGCSGCMTGMGDG